MIEELTDAQRHQLGGALVTSEKSRNHLDKLFTEAHDQETYARGARAALTELAAKKLPTLFAKIDEEFEAGALAEVTDAVKARELAKLYVQRAIESTLSFSRTKENEASVAGGRKSAFKQAFDQASAAMQASKAVLEGTVPLSQTQPKEDSPKPKPNGSSGPKRSLKQALAGEGLEEGAPKAPKRKAKKKAAKKKATHRKAPRKAR